MSDTCDFSIINADGWTDACNRPATGTAYDDDGWGEYVEFPACDEHKERDHAQ